MNTQNLDYSEIAKENQIVADAFSARDDVQIEVDAVIEEMESINAQLKERQEALAVHIKNLAVADDKLALLATMAQDHIDQVAAIKERHEREKAAIYQEVDRVIFEVLDSIEKETIGDDSIKSSLGEIRDALGITVIPNTNLQEDHREVQAELELAS
jgi:hypothetical protein